MIVCFRTGDGQIAAMLLRSADETLNVGPLAENEAMALVTTHP